MKLAASLVAAATPAPAPAMPWANKFVGTALFAVGTPGWGMGLTYGDHVIGSPVGYASLADARAAVAELRPSNPLETEPSKMAAAVAYLTNGYGAYAAIETTSSLAWKTMFKKQLKTFDAFTQLTPAVIAVDNWRGDSLRNRGRVHF